MEKKFPIIYGISAILAEINNIFLSSSIGDTGGFWFVIIRKIEIILRNDSLTLNYTKMAHKISEDCTACGTCINECPVEAISEGDIYKINPELCTDCGACADVCPVEAIHPE